MVRRMLLMVAMMVSLSGGAERRGQASEARRRRTGLSLHLNGCPNSCARIQVADIGLKGQLLKGEDGADEFAFQVHLGGGLAASDREEAGLGRTVRGLKVASAQLPDYVERVVRSFVASRVEDESFAAWAHRVDEEALR